MPVESDDDRTALLADFGIGVEIDGEQITAVMDDEWQDQNGISVTVPVLTVRTIDVPNLARGQVLYLTETSDKYTVQEIMPDGQGMTMLVLQAE